MKVRIFMILAVALCLAASGLSQAIDGIITGRVEDTSGARIPGVSIVLTSPAILGERTLVTDESGSYRFANLPAGTFRIKFDLPGFKTLIRDGIIVEGGKTVTLPVQLEVASVAETVTVTGESPIVDIEQAKIGVNFSSALKDNIVNSRDYWTLLSVTPGIKTTNVDIGGSQMGTQVAYRAYGRSGQVKIMLDGVDLTEGNNSGSMYGDYGSWEEVQVSAAGNSAEMMTGGTSVVAMVRSGGNDFHGTLYLAYDKASFQSANLDDSLRNRGITTGDRFTRYTDWNLDVGGPIKKDKFWYYGSFRNEYSGLQTQLRQNNGARYTLPASGIAPNLCSQLPCIGDNPDGAPRGGLFYTRLTNGTVKLSYQINPTNQLSATANARLKLQPYRGGQGTGARDFTPDATQRQESWFHTARAQWVSTLSNRTTLDVSLNNFGYYWVNLANVVSPRLFDRGSSGATRSYTQGSYIGDLMNNRRWHENIVLSQFLDGPGGSHNLKAGYVLMWEDRRTTTRGYPGHLRYVFENGVPNRIEVFNTPVQWSQGALLVNSLFLQDKWQIGRKLTLNAGIRFDRMSAYLPEQVRESAGQNPFANAADIVALETFGNQRYAKRNVAKFNSPVPRIAFVYDVFGNGKTAIKASYGRFAFNPSYELANQARDNVSRNASYTWNGTMPFTPEYLRSCLANRTCSLISGPRLTQTRIDPNLKDPHITEFTAGVDQELFNEWNIRFNFVRKIDEGQYGTINQQYKITDYAPFDFRDVGRDGVAGSQDDAIITAYRLNVPTRTNDPFVTYIDGAGDMFRTWEVEAIKRMSHGWQLITGADWTKRDLGPDLFTTDPNLLIFRYGRIPGSHYWDWTAKVVLQYDLPWGLKYSTVYRTQKGEAHTRTINVNCDRVLAPGQTCSQAGGRAPSPASFNLVVENSGTNEDFYPAWKIWDMRISKEFDMERFGKAEFIFDVFNILNENTITSWTTSTGTTRNLDGSTVPTFQRPSSIFPPRKFRLGLRYSF